MWRGRPRPRLLNLLSICCGWVADKDREAGRIKITVKPRGQGAPSATPAIRGCILRGVCGIMYGYG